MDRGVTVPSSRIERWQLRQLRPGDHIYTWRSVYSHHGIYESDRKVIHFTSPSDSSSSSSFSSSAPTAAQTCWDCAQANRKGGVIITCLDCFLKGGDVCVFVYSAPWWLFVPSNATQIQPTCSMKPEDPPETVLHRANNLLANGFGSYNVALNNCMHFALYCKIGDRSKQPATEMEMMAGLLKAYAPELVVVGLASNLQRHM